MIQPATLRRFQQLMMRYGSASVAAAMLTAPAKGQEQEQIAAAQEQTESHSSENIEEIVVTAQFRAENLQDTPIAITAQTGEMLAERGITTVTQLVAVAPNVNLTPNPAIFGVSASAFIRGIGQYDNNFAYEPGVGMYLDDIYYGVITGADFALADVDRVEILRGPQGTLSGKNSLGGSIKLYNRKPRGDGSGYIDATYGRFDRFDVKGAYDVALIDDVLAMRVAAFSNQKDGYLKRLDFACVNPAQAGNIPRIGSGDNCVIGRDGGVSNSGLRAAVRYTPGTNIEINVAVDRTVDESPPSASSLFYAFMPFAPRTYNDVPIANGGTPYDARFIPENPYNSYATYRDPTTGFDPGALTRTASSGISGDIDWDIGENFNVRSITGYRDLTSLASFDQDASPIGGSTYLLYNTYHQFTQELRLSQKYDLFEWTVGSFYYDAKGVLKNTVISGTTQFITDDPVNTTSKSAFAHFVLHPTENLNITSGIRYTDDKKTYDFTRFNSQGGPANPAQAPLNLLPLQVYSGDRVDYRLGADYRFSPEVMIYGQYSTGYKGGGMNPRPFSIGQAVPFDPETVGSWEAGVKTDLANRRVRLNLAAFYTKYEDIQLVNGSGFCVGGETPANSSCALSAVPFNAGDANIKGIEIEADVRPVRAWSITGALSYLDFEYTRLADSALASRIQYDDYPPLTPEWKWSAGTAYSFDLGHRGQITPRLDVEYQSKTYSDPVNDGFYAADLPVPPAFAHVNPFLIPSRTTMNARLTYETADSEWQIAAVVKNLTNEFYWTNTFAFYARGNGVRTVAPPREWSISIRRNF